MGKFMKGCAITALILVVLGLAMVVTGGTVVGTDTVKEMVSQITDGNLHINLGGEEGFGIFFDEDALFGTEINYDISENMIFENGYEIWHGDVEKHAVGSNVQGLNIEAAGCQFLLRESGDSQFHIEAEETGKLQCYIKNEVLYVKATRDVDDWDDFDDCEIILYIPADYSLGKTEIELGAGLLEMDVLIADEIDLEVGAGQITANYLRADKCNVEVGMGEILIDDMHVTNVNAEVGMGHLEMKGTVSGDINGECAMGAMELYLTGREEAFNYTIKAAMGNVSLDGQDYSGLAQDKVVKNDADKEITLECAMGNIQLEFEE